MLARQRHAFCIEEIACQRSMDERCKQRAITRGGVGHEPSRSPRFTSFARGEWRSERSERAKLTSPPRRPRVNPSR